MARRRQLVVMLVAERARRAQAQPGPVRLSLARVVTTLEADLKELDAHIDKTVRGTPVWRDKEDLLASVPGIGKTIARTLLAELQAEAGVEAGDAHGWIGSNGRPLGPTRRVSDDGRAGV